MAGSIDNVKKILEYREEKSMQLKRHISFSEAIALWISESLKAPILKKQKDQNAVMHTEIYNH